MMNKKKELPLIVLEILEKFVHLHGKTFQIIEPGELLLKVTDKDNSSPFYFHIEQCALHQNVYKFLLDCKPVSKHNNGNLRTWIKMAELETLFNSWVEILEGYEKVKSFYDDPILEAFEEEYFAEFEILEEDKNRPLSLKQILFLDEHLEQIENALVTFENDVNRQNLQEIKGNINELRETLANKSKEFVLKSLIKIWAKISKEGPKFIKEILSEVKKQAVIEGVKFFISHGKDLI